MRLLHTRTDLLGRRHARRTQGRRAQPRHRRPRGVSRRLRRRATRTHERQPLSLRGLPEHRRRHPSGAAMIPFEYRRATSVQDAVTAIAERPDAVFLAGGTNLVDHMKLGVIEPGLLVDVGHLPLADVDLLPTGTLRIGADVRNSDLAAHPVVRSRYPVLARALLSA